MSTSDLSRSLYALLDTLIAAKIDLCDLNGNPSHSSLNEHKFQQACEALGEGIGLVKKLAADADGQMAGGLPDRASRAATNYGNACLR